MSGGPIQSCVGHGKVRVSVPYTAGCVTSSLNATCPQSHHDNQNHPHKFPKLPLGGSTFPTEDHSSNRTEALDGLMKGLWGECLQIWLA